MRTTGALVAGLAAGAVLLAGCGGGSQATPDSLTTATTTATTATTTTTSAVATVTPAPTTAPAPATGREAQRSPSSLPAVSARARKAGLRDVRTVVTDAVIDLRYATKDNFTKTRLYPRHARCLIHSSLAKGLAAAGRAARRAGLQLVFWDCYRPHAVQVRMFRIVPDPAWVARPGRYARSHEAGRSVDVTLARHGRHLQMGTGFDAFTARATAYATKGVSAKAERNRALLRKIMRAGRLRVYAGEWWHFDGPGADRQRPFLRAPVY